jgi:hypothetical protein
MTSAPRHRAVSHLFLLDGLGIVTLLAPEDFPSCML